MIFLNVDPNEMEKIPMHPATGQFYYGVSLYGIFYCQPRKPEFKSLVAPKPLIDMVSKMFQLGAKLTQGIFRLPGNMDMLDTMIWDIEHGKPYLEGKTVHDVASLFKRWYRDLPGSVLGKHEVDELMRASSDDAMMELACRLPMMQKFCLMYLIGFLKEMVAPDVVAVTMTTSECCLRQTFCTSTPRLIQ